MWFRSSATKRLYSQVYEQELQTYIELMETVIDKLGRVHTIILSNITKLKGRDYDEILDGYVEIMKILLFSSADKHKAQEIDTKKRFIGNHVCIDGILVSQMYVTYSLLAVRNLCELKEPKTTKEVYDKFKRIQEFLKDFENTINRLLINAQMPMAS